MATPSAGDLRNFAIVGHASSGKSAAFSDFREILAHIFFGFSHLGSKRQVERLPRNLIDSFNYVS
jgi:hypothetical protein